MDIEQLKTFVYISITKSFKQTSKIMYISQPTVSARIKSLEKELGFMLFSRHKSGITLTQKGEVFLSYVKKSIMNLELGLSAVQNIDSNVRGDLTISAVVTMSNLLLPLLIKRFKNNYPDINLSIRTGHSDDVLEMVLNHEVSLGIVRSVTHPDIDSVHLFDDQFILAVYSDHPFVNSRNKVFLKNLSKESLILFNRMSIDRTMINNTFNKLNIKPHIMMETDNINLIEQMVINKMGIALIPRIAILENLKENKLHEIDIHDFPVLKRPFELIYLKNTQLNLVSKTFYQFITNKINW